MFTTSRSKKVYAIHRNFTHTAEVDDDIHSKHLPFICFSVFGYPDETLALVVDILLKNREKTPNKLNNRV